MTTDYKSKIAYLSELIDNSILPLITSDYVFWGLPYYSNPGDTLIWEGSLNMLKKCQYKCIGTCGWNDYKYIPLRKETVILIIGGGFFGDLWRKAWSAVMDTITLYPDNPIVILPQSIYYENKEIEKSDSERLAKCKNLTICLRDEVSYNYAKSHFLANKSILVPDMAFHANLDKFSLAIKKPNKQGLFLKRNDKEFPSGFSFDNNNCDISDWPTMSGRSSLPYRFFDHYYRKLEPYKGSFSMWIKKQMMYYPHRYITLFDSIKFLSQYETIYSTRLHAALLAWMIGRNVVILNNSYGKIGNLYKTWLTDCENISLYGQ